MVVTGRVPELLRSCLSGLWCWCGSAGSMPPVMPHLSDRRSHCVSSGAYASRTIVTQQHKQHQQRHLRQHWSTTNSVKHTVRSTHVWLDRHLHVPLCVLSVNTTGRSTLVTATPRGLAPVRSCGRQHHHPAGPSMAGHPPHPQRTCMKHERWCQNRTSSHCHTLPDGSPGTH